MKTPTSASLKKVTKENLAALGADRLAEILAETAGTRPDLKRRLRMELAAALGPEHLTPEIDRRIASLQASRGKISWRQRPAFVRDLEALRALIAGRLAELDPAAALARLWALMAAARRVSGRLRDRDGSLAAVFDQVAQDLGRLLADAPPDRAAAELAEALAEAPLSWVSWLPTVLARTSPGFAGRVLRRLSDRPGATAAWIPLIRQLADAAGDPGAFQSTFTHKDLVDPAVAAQVAQRFLAAGQLAPAAALLEGARGSTSGRGMFGRGAAPELTFEWESAWIEVLEKSGQAEAAQEARWASFERTLSAERAREFARRLADFEDVEAEGRAFAYAAAHEDLALALGFLMDWPALDEAARLILARSGELRVPVDTAELWAAKLRVRRPAAAEALLRRAAAEAFRRREFAICDRLTAEADAIAD